ncbi:asparagine synthase [Candidatus Parvarchaeota archaeon]|nr:asparagine synthase [Candidatus Parvarchaeota archaeon]
MSFSPSGLEAIIEKGIKRSEKQVVYISRQLAISLKKSVMLAIDDANSTHVQDTGNSGSGNAGTVKCAVAFSGGLDSTIIAKCAIEKDPGVLLVCAGFEGSKDVEAATKIARRLGARNLILEKLTCESLMANLEECKKIHEGTFLEMELMLGAYSVCKAAKQSGVQTILFGSGAEELFAGYERHYDKYEGGEDLLEVLKVELKALPRKDLSLTAKVAAHFGLQVAFPFIDEDIITIAYGCTAESKIFERQMKKPQLREAAAKLGLPPEAVHRPKVAMQYGMGIHKILSEKYNENPGLFRE